MLANFINWKTLIALLLSGGVGLSFLFPASAAIVSAFAQTKLGRYVIVGGAIALAVLVAVGWVETNAVTKERQRVEDLNRRVIDRANEAAIPVEQCYNKGGEWIQERGVCKLP